MLTVADIRVYPVKGLRGFSVRESFVEPWGLLGDRRWMVVDPQNTFISQRQVPRMATVDAALLDGGLRLASDGLGTVDVPDPDAAAQPVEVAIWKKQVPAVAAGPGAHAWLSAALGTNCRLVYMADPANARPADPAYASPADRVSFADGYPLLITNDASLADLNCRLERPVTMDRFRTNLVVTGGAPWGEDLWRALRIGDAEFAAVKNCDRCVVTTVDQMSGHRAENNEPLRTLGSFRRDSLGRIIFGQNLIPTRLGPIAVGNEVHVGEPLRQPGM